MFKLEPFILDGAYAAPAVGGPLRPNRLGLMQPLLSVGLFGPIAWGFCSPCCQCASSVQKHGAYAAPVVGGPLRPNRLGLMQPLLSVGFFSPISPRCFRMVVMRSVIQPAQR